MKNSAGVTFNENTDLIIEADPDGTVTSCYNKSNNTEYVGGGSSDFSTAEVTITLSVEYGNTGLYMPLIRRGLCSVNEIVTSMSAETLLYNGELGVVLPDNLNITTTGNAEIISEGQRFLIITGDCGIDISLPI